MQHSSHLSKTARPTCIDILKSATQYTTVRMETERYAFQIPNEKRYTMNACSSVNHFTLIYTPCT